MPLAPIFSTYKQGENRVTAALMAVLARLPLPATDEILSDMLGDSVSLVTFRPLPATKGPGNPDGQILASVDILFEVKTVRGALKSAKALRIKAAYLQKLRGSMVSRLVLLTPDTQEPAGLSAIDDDRVSWYSFARLAGAFENLLSDIDGQELLAERDRFLVREFLSLLKQENLLENEDTLVLAAGHAYPWYLSHNTYICQPNRAFRDVTRIAFYTGKEIKPEIPQIISTMHAVTFTDKDAQALIQTGDKNNVQTGNAVLEAIRVHPAYHGATQDVYVLSSPTAPETVTLDSPIRRTEPGPWTYGQPRYVFLEDLRSATTTEELDRRSSNRRSA